GAPFRGEAAADQRLIDLAVEPGERLRRPRAAPPRLGAAAPVEDADAGERDLHGRVADRRERGVDVARHVAIDLADEAQGEVKLFIALPARAANPAHQPEEPGADRRRRAQGDEEALHATGIAEGDGQGTGAAPE